MPKLLSCDQVFLRSVERTLRVIGVPSEHYEEALRRVRLEHQRAPDELIDPATANTFARALHELTGDDALGLRLAESMVLGSTAVVEYVLKTARSFSAALSLYQSLSTLTNDYVRFRPVEIGNYTRIEFVMPSDVKMYPVLEDYRLLRVARLPCHGFGDFDFEVSTVHFTYPKPSPSAMRELSAYFGPTVRFEFGRARAALELPTSDFEREFVTHDNTLHHILFDTAMQQLELTRTSLSRVAIRVSNALMDLLPGGRRPTSGEIARQLGMSERSLRRRLSEEGTTFAALLDDVRARTARALSRSQEPSTDTLARKLGFGSVRQYRRAERRWAKKGVSANP